LLGLHDFEVKSNCGQAQKLDFTHGNLNGLASDTFDLVLWLFDMLGIWLDILGLWFDIST
jgi:hypothetical protein